MNWIEIAKRLSPLPIKQRVFLWDHEQETATVGEFLGHSDDESHFRTIVSAYGNYFELTCFSHYALIESPIYQTQQSTNYEGRV